MQFSDNPQNLPAYSDFKGLSNFFEGTDTEQWIEQQERELWLRTGEKQSKIDYQLQALQHRVEKARTLWACISSKTQREEKRKFKNGISFVVDTYNNLTSVQYHYERAGGMKPPDRTGKPIFHFSKKSRTRMMQKARKLNKSGLPIPYFITLTYHKNFKDCNRAKQHLNAFFQRWRRRSPETAYFWKMEFQQRGAIHFHIALFIPESVPVESYVSTREKNRLTEKMTRSGKYESHSPRSVALMILSGNDWAEITADVDGVDVPFTRFDYLRKRDYKPETYRVKGNTRTVNTRAANPRVEYKMEPDILHRLYGTNVRVCNSWKQFIGYVGEYMKKEVFKSEIPDGVKTGRFWGYSYNLDFKALQTGIVDFEDLQQMNSFCNTLNAETFRTITRHLCDSAERAKKYYSGKKLQGKLKKYRNTYEAQKRRFLINREKIKRGYSLQFEINHKKVTPLREFLPEKTVKEAFKPPD